MIIHVNASRTCRLPEKKPNKKAPHIQRQRRCSATLGMHERAVPTKLSQRGSLSLSLGSKRGDESSFKQPAPLGDAPRREKGAAEQLVKTHTG